MGNLIQKSLFEEGFLIRSLGEIAYRPEIAISELVANAWDAGAVHVAVTIPAQLGEEVSVVDDGIGLSEQQFKERWMKLGYRRTQHQGEWAEIPSTLSQWKRRAYGRNGQGRHGMLCFADNYTVETQRDGTDSKLLFLVEAVGQESPFVLTDVSLSTQKFENHGCKVSTTVQKHLPRFDSIVESLSLTFLHDPQFTITVNGVPVSVESFEVSDEADIEIPQGRATVTFRKIPTGKKSVGRSGVAFWVGKRLVGQPDYNLFGVPLIDGRSTVARNHLIVIQSDDLYDHVKPDWSGFKRTGEIEELLGVFSAHVTSVVSRLNSSAIDETKNEAYQNNREGLQKLTKLGQVEVTEFVDDLVSRFPTLNVDILTAAIAAAVNLEKSRSGQKLLSQLARITESEAEQLSSLMEQWTVRDAMCVLDEVSRRMTTIEAMKKLRGDKSADELHTIHPLVAHARWLFGPEYDSPYFLSNTTIQRAASTVFRKKIDAKQIDNPRQRPDLLFAKDATFGITGVEHFDSQTGVATLNKMLLIELKRGDSTIVLKHITQAQQYIQDLLSCGLLDGPPFIQAFVVGYRIDSRLTPIDIGDPTTRSARVVPVTFDQLIRTAEQRLFQLNRAVENHFKDVPAVTLVQKILGSPTGPTLFDSVDANVSRPKKRRSASTI